jgi:uncharacterized protein YdaU (DUF1376 family)
MTNRPNSFMPLYTGDWLRSVTHLTPQERDAYMLLVMRYWDTGLPLPNDDARLARIALISDAEWSAIKATVKAFFKVTLKETMEVLEHTRVESELAKATKRYASRKEVSDKANAAKKAKVSHQGNREGDLQGDHQANPQGSQPQPQPQSLSSPLTGRNLETTRKRAGSTKSPAPPAASSEGPVDTRWEAAYPKWLKVRQAFGDALWLSIFADCRPNGSETTLIVGSKFWLEKLETQFSDKLERLFGEPVKFKLKEETKP